jgi:hypothetical protein
MIKSAARRRKRAPSKNGTCPDISDVAVVQPPRRGGKPTLDRSTLQTSRLLDFFTEKELTAQIGHAKRDWPLVALKELIDNGTDAAEDAGVAPHITIEVGTGTITVTDNGPGIPPETVAGLCNYSVRVSSREHYVSPTRAPRAMRSRPSWPCRSS